LQPQASVEFVIAMFLSAWIEAFFHPDARTWSTPTPFGVTADDVELRASFEGAVQTGPLKGKPRARAERPVLAVKRQDQHRAPLTPLAAATTHPQSTH
jgi:hypothetical protein